VWVARGETLLDGRHQEVLGLQADLSITKVIVTLMPSCSSLNMYHRVTFT
jgi:hypothetical protein